MLKPVSKCWCFYDLFAGQALWRVTFGEISSRETVSTELEEETKRKFSPHRFILSTEWLADDTPLDCHVMSIYLEKAWEASSLAQRWLHPLCRLVFWLLSNLLIKPIESDVETVWSRTLNCWNCTNFPYVTHPFTWTRCQWVKRLSALRSIPDYEKPAAVTLKPCCKTDIKSPFHPSLDKRPSLPPSPPQTGGTIEDTLSIHWTNRLQQERKKDGLGNSSIFLFDFDNLLLPEPFSSFSPFSFFLPAQCSLLWDVSASAKTSFPISARLFTSVLSHNTLKHFLLNGSLHFFTATCHKFDVFLHVSDVEKPLRVRTKPSARLSARHLTHLILWCLHFLPGFQRNLLILLDYQDQSAISQNAIDYC